MGCQAYRTREGVRKCQIFQCFLKRCETLVGDDGIEPPTAPV